MDRSKSRRYSPWSEVIYLIADIFALASVASARAGDYVEEICEFWEGVCEPVIHYLI
jgi:hypothetical protein